MLTDLMIANLPQGKPTDLYPFLLTWWVKFVSSPNPNRKEIASLHKRLSNLEARLCPAQSKLCLENLLRRLEDASQLGLSLQLPLWPHIYEPEAFNAWADKRPPTQKKQAA